MSAEEENLAILVQAVFNILGAPNETFHTATYNYSGHRLAHGTGFIWSALNLGRLTRGVYSPPSWIDFPDSTATFSLGSSVVLDHLAN